MCKVSAKKQVYSFFCRAAAIFMQKIEADGRRFGNFEMDTILGKDGHGAIVTKEHKYAVHEETQQGKECKGTRKNSSTPACAIPF